MKDLAKKLQLRFAGGDYFIQYKEGPAMHLEEIVDSPFFRKFYVLFNKDKNQIQKILTIPSISFMDQLRDSSFDSSVVNELEELVDKDKLTAVIFMTN